MTMQKLRHSESTQIISSYVTYEKLILSLDYKRWVTVCIFASESNCIPFPHFDWLGVNKDQISMDRKDKISSPLRLEMVDIVSWSNWDLAITSKKLLRVIFKEKDLTATAYVGKRKSLTQGTWFHSISKTLQIRQTTPSRQGYSFTTRQHRRHSPNPNTIEISLGSQAWA